MRNNFRLPLLWNQTSPASDFGLTSELSRFVDDFWKPELPATALNFSPRLDIKETGNELKVMAELPGVDEKDVKIELHDSTLTIRGEKRTEKEEKEESYHRVERSYGNFMRQVVVPNYVDSEKVSAEFKNGLLTVSMAKKNNEEQKRTIEIKSK